MNHQLIEKVIKSNDTNACPEFSYENPLLDHNVAKALSKSFVKILRCSQQNTNINNNLRHSVLANIRKTCRLQPENHVEINENLTNLLTEVYIEEIKDPHTNLCTNPVEKYLDDFLTRKLKVLDVNSNYKSSLNLEVAQSLINLHEKSIETISQNILNIDLGKKKNITFIKDLWTKPYSAMTNICDISLSMKPEIEMNLLNICHSLLIEQSIDFTEIFNLDSIKNLVQKSAISPKCFQICCGILHCLFSTVNYNSNIQLFISKYINDVQEMCPNTISILYPGHLSHIVVLLNTDAGAMPTDILSVYVLNTLSYLKSLHKKSESDLVLLLSHYPDWFDIYFNQ